MRRFTLKHASVRIHILHLLDGRCTDNVVDSDNVLVLEAQKDFDLSQGSLAVGLVLKGADLLDGHAYLVLPVVGRAVFKKTNKNPKIRQKCKTFKSIKLKCQICAITALIYNYDSEPLIRTERPQVTKTFSLW